MIKTKRIFLTSIVIILCIALVMTAFACSKKDTVDGDDSDKVTELFTNGNFTEFTTPDDEKSALVPSSWSGNPGSTSASASIKTPQAKTDLTAGIIDVTSKKLSSNFGISNPGKVGDDNYVMMLRNITATSYNFKSSSVTLSSDGYYKLTISVKTVDVEPGTAGDTYGAWITVTGDAYASFEAVNTNSAWKNYAVYFKTAKSTDSKITLTLSLGNGNLETGHMTKGYAFFDNVVLEDLTDVEEGETAFTTADFDAVEYTDSVYKYDMNYADSTFNAVSAETSLPYTPAQYTGKAGSGTGNNASTSSSYLDKGIIDISAAAQQNYTLPIELSTVEGSVGDRMLFINNKQETAYSYTANVGMNIEKSKFYKISACVKTDIVSGSGAMVALSNGQTNVIKSVAIDSADWTSVTFYLQAAEYVDTTVFPVFSLGTGGSGDNDWVKGVALFDELSFAEIEESEYTDALTATPQNCKSFATGIGDEVALSALADVNKTTTAPAATEVAVVDTTNWASSAFASIDNPGSVLSTRPNVLVINNYLPTSFAMSTLPILAGSENEVDDTNANLLTILPNTAYEFSFWVKTKDVKAGSGINVTLVSYDSSKQDDYTNAFTNILAASKINSEDLESYKDEVYNDYVRFTMYVLGAEKEVTHAAVQITFGSGDSGLISTDFLSGYFFLTNFETKVIDYTTYSSVSTSTTTLKTSLGGNGSASGTLSSNGYFDLVDVSASKELDSSIFDADGNMVKPAVPSVWTSTNSSLLTANGGLSTAGVIDVNSGFVSTDLPYEIDEEKHSNVLYINAVNTKSLGYKSSNLSLSANSYYVISVFAKCTEGSFSIDVAPSTNTDVTQTATYYLNSNVGNDWNLYLVYVKTGVTSITATVTLYAGYPANAADTTSTVFFTGATYAQIDKDIYDIAEANHDAIVTPDYDKLASRSSFLSWLADTMDATTSSADTLSTPSNWTGSAVDTSSKVTSEYVGKGLFNQTTGDWKTLDIDPDADDSVADKIFDAEKEGNAIGDSVLAIYNKKKTTYSYKSANFNLEAGSFYKISIDVLTNNLAYLTKEDDEYDADDSTFDKLSDMNLAETATISLTINNKTYTFGSSVVKDKTAADFETEAEYNNYKLNSLRLVNTNGKWVTYTFFVALDEDIEETLTASIKLSLGGKNVNYWISGHLFADNFIVEELTETEYEEQAPACACTEDEDSEDYDPTILSDEDAKTNIKIAFTNDDANAEEEAEEEEEPEAPKKETSWVWLYITSGVIGAVIVVVLVIYLIKRYAPKKKIKKSKKTTITSDSTRGKFSN